MTQNTDPKAQGNEAASKGDQTSPPDASAGKSSGQKPAVTMFLQADMDKAVSEARTELSQRLTEQGREIAGMKNTIKLVPLVNAELNRLTVENATLQKRIEDGESEGARKDPDLFDVTKRTREINSALANLRTREQTLGLQELAFSSDMEDLSTLRHQSNLTRICGEKGVPVEAVAALSPKTVEEMEVYADNIAKAGGYKPPEAKSAGGAPPVLEGGVGAGGGVSFEDMSAEEKIRWAVEHPQK